MEISKVKTANKMGSFVLRENHKKYKISFNFLDQITKETKNHRKGRVYFFVVNDKIKKIGGSSDRKVLQEQYVFIQIMEGLVQIDLLFII